MQRLRPADVQAENHGIGYLACPMPAKEQRGVKRPQGGNGNGEPACDIGVYEGVGQLAPGTLGQSAQVTTLTFVPQHCC